MLLTHIGVALAVLATFRSILRFLEIQDGGIKMAVIWQLGHTFHA